MIYFLRHGLDDEKYVGGWSDVDLIEEGIEDTKKVAINIKERNLPIKKIIFSNVLRAKTTAAIVSDILKIKNIESSDVFREQNKGILNGILKTEMEKNYPEFKEENVRIEDTYPGGESLLDLYKRIKDNLEYILSLDEDTLVITHRGVINMLYYILNDIPLDMNKKRFGVTHSSLHELNQENKQIRKVL